MISGAHVVLFSTDPEADRAFFKEVLGLPNVDAGGGWLIFALPPTELAVHPAEGNDEHELFLTCADLKRTIKKLAMKKVKCSRPEGRPWGLLSRISLPGGGTICLYEPRHRSAHA
jgi:catechol 2,3-dioxygenase-like lactoylglutathione lyase family enzyme